jgi:hypothetical protein
MTDRLRRTARPNLVTLESRVTPALAFALAGSNLYQFDTEFPGFTKPPVAITNVAAGETLQTIDVRPQNGHLYGLATNATGGVRLYDISPRTGRATPLTAAAVTFTDALNNPVVIGGTRFEMDFNPSVDRIRVTTDTGINFRMNPNTGTLVDGVAGAGIDPDLPLVVGVNPAASGGTAYTNSFVNTGVTTQYTIDTTTKQLFIQNPPNNGVLTKGVSISTDGVTAVNFTATGGFDIPSTVSVAAGNDVAAGNGFAVLTVDGKATLYTVNLTSGLATPVGTVGDGSVAITGLAVAERPADGFPVVTFDGTNLVRFSADTPGTTKSVAITGVLASETLVGIDYRPATGQLVGLGVDANTDTSTLYLIDPQTGAASLLVAGTQSAITFAGTDLTDPATTGYGVDFNPTVDRVRVVTSNGLNFRLNPTNGLAVDADGNAGNGNTPDGGINGPATGLFGTAYTNSFGGVTTTTQYGIDATTNSLYIQNAPNAGTQTLPIAITLNGAALDFTSVSGFDISPAFGTTAANAAVAIGTAVAGLTVNGVTGLYDIDLTTGAATLRSTLAAGVRGLAIADDLGLLQSVKVYAAGSGRGVANSVVVYNPDGSVRFTFQPYEASFTGGVYVATGDVTGDGVEDIITGTGNGGGPLVKLFDGTDGSLIRQYFAYEQSFRGGVIVAAGDTNGDGIADVITGTGVGGGPRVRVLSGVNDAELANYFAYEESFRGGVLVGAGDVNGDGKADVITGTGVGGGPRVRALSGNTTTELANFFAYEDSFRGGVFAAAGNLLGSANAEIIAGTGIGGGPRVTVFDSGTLASVANFFAFDANNRGGVSVSTVDRDGDGVADIVVGSGLGLANLIRVVTTANATILSDTPFADSFLGGVNVG